MPFEFFLAFGWLAAVIAASIIYRRSAGKPILPRVPDTAVFAEKWRSGRSLRNLLTRLGGASHCLLVYVDDGALSVVPMFPFNLMFLPEIFGLEITAPVRTVNLADVDGRFRKTAIVTINGPDEQRLELAIKDRQALRRAVEGN